MSCASFTSIHWVHARRIWFRRYFCYLNLFVFNMLILVCANNFLLLFVGWKVWAVLVSAHRILREKSRCGRWQEGVHRQPSGRLWISPRRISDFYYIRYFNFTDVMAAAPDKLTYGGIMPTLITLLLFVGATGKSAQIPLYTWLPDAMEGPTPSAH